MSVAEQNNAQIERLKGLIKDSFTACSEKDAIMPSTELFANLPGTIRSIQTGVPDGYINLADVINHCTQSANGSYTKTSDTTMKNISVTVGFRPKVFVLTNLGGVVSNSTSTAKNHLLTSLIICDDEGNILLKFSSYLYYTSSGFMGSRSVSAANTLAATENGVIGGSGTSVVARANVEYQWYAWG